MKFNTSWLADIFDWVGDTFETFSPAAFRFLSAVLPYVTPFPVAWLTMKSASEFLHFTPNIAFTFVFALEGMGLWFTSLFVDAVVDWIKSKNWKTGFLVLMFGVVVAIYVFILVQLNVKLEMSNTESNETLAQVITLLCFLPLLTGIGNGYYKLKLEGKRQLSIRSKFEDDKEERIRQEKRADRNMRYAMKHGYALDTVQLGQQLGQFPSVQGKDSEQLGQFSGNWKVDSKRFDVDDLKWIASSNANEISIKFGIGRSTSYNWIGYATEALAEIGE